MWRRTDVRTESAIRPLVQAWLTGKKALISVNAAMAIVLRLSAPHTSRNAPGILLYAVRALCSRSRHTGRGSPTTEDSFVCCTPNMHYLLQGVCRAGSPIAFAIEPLFQGLWHATTPEPAMDLTIW